MEQSFTPNYWRAWFLAARPKTLTASLVPILVATALSSTLDAVTINWHLVLCAFIATLSIQVGTNLINDALDFVKGADTAQRLGPQRATHMGWLSPRQVYTGGILAFALGALASLPIISHAGWPIVAVLLFSIACGYLYTGGPKPLAYHGMGELFIFLFFGWVATVTMVYVLTDVISPYAWLAGTQLGLLCTALGAINNARDESEDRITGKKTLAVRFGTRFGKWEITLLILLPYLLNLIWLWPSYYPVVTFPFLALPIARWIVASVWKYPPGPIYNSLLALASVHYLLFGLLMTIGFVVMQ